MTKDNCANVLLDQSQCAVLTKDKNASEIKKRLLAAGKKQNIYRLI